MAPTTSARVPVPTVSAVPVGQEKRCGNSEVGYELAYPADWFVHPADPSRDIAPCSLFAAEPFEYRPVAPADFGASVYVSDFEGGCVEFDMIDPHPDVLEDVTVAGLPAHRIVFRPPGALELHSYLVNLRPQDGPVLQGDACGHSHGLSIRSDRWAGGDYELNTRVVDRMAATLEVERVFYPPGVGADPHCPFPRDVELTFEGESTLRALGFDPGTGPLAEESGMVYVTAGPIPLGNPRPQRAYCQVIEREDQTFSTVGVVPATWELPPHLPSLSPSP